ncbi:MAG: thioredoxin family protein [Thermoguttaceae bacterium]
MATAWLAVAPAADLPDFAAGGSSEAAALGLAGPPSDAKDVVSIDSRFTPPSAGKPGKLLVTAKIRPEWYIYSITQPAGGPLATKITVTPPPGVRIGKFQASPAPSRSVAPEFDNLKVETHRGSVTWSAPIELAGGADPASAKIEGKITFQCCHKKDGCMTGGLPFLAGVSHEAPPAAAASANSVDSGALWLQLLAAFVGGLILNVMPCVLPVVSLKILAFVQQAGESRGRIFALNVWYSAGLLAVFMILATLAVSVGLAWGEQFTLPWFKVTMTAFVFAMALAFLGVWQLPIPGFVGTGRTNELQQKEGPSGAFFKGVFTTILATPCSGPFLGPVFGYLLNQPPQVVYYVFAAVGLGMASPYLLIGAFPKLIGFLPKPGAWMGAFEQLMGFLLLATVVYLFSTLSHWYFIPTLALLVSVWFACWWIGRTPLTASPRVRATAWWGGFATITLVALLSFTLLFWQPIIPWQRFTPAALEQARAEGKTVMVDFTADWCPNCKANSRFAIERAAVLRLVSANGVVPMLADWTDRSPTIKQTLNDLGCNSIPVLAIWPTAQTGQKPIVLQDLLKERDVLEALKQAGPSKNLQGNGN